MIEKDVRTGEHHGYIKQEAIVDQFEVDALPAVDFAARALRIAQDDYFKQYPFARKEANELLWKIRKVKPAADVAP